MEEYDYIVQKDKEQNKDFNKLALQEMKKARYYFDYLREQQRTQ